MIYILDNDLNIVGQLNNDVPNGTPFYDDTLSRRIADDTTKNWLETYQVSVPSQYPEAELLEFGNHLLIQCEDGRFRLYTIDEVSDTINGVGHMKKVNVAYNTFQVHMRNYNYIAEEKVFNPATTPEIIKYLCANVGWDYGELDELYLGAAKTFTVSQGNAMESLSKFIQEFDIQIDAYVEINQGKISNKRVEFSKTLTDDKPVKARFEYRRDLMGATRTKNNDDFYTMVYAYTAEDENNKRQGIESVNNIVNPTTGQKENLPYVYDSEANDRYNNGKDYRVVHIYSETLTTPEATLSWAKQQLKYYNHPKYTYEVEVATFQDQPGLGDKIQVIDLEMTPPLAITAVVVATETSFADPSKNKITLGEYQEVPITTISSIQSLQNQLAELNKKSNTYTIDEYTADLGSETRLMVVVRENGVKVDLAPENYKWRRTAIDTNTIDESWSATGAMVDVLTADYEIFYYECVVLVDVAEYDLILRSDFKKAMPTFLQKVSKYTKEDSIVFGFITDTHYDPNDVRTEVKETAARALQYTNNLIESSKHVSMDAVVHGGDIIDGRKASPDTAKIDLDSAVGVYRNAKAPRLLLRGNHDSNPLFYKDGGKSADKYKASGFIPQSQANNILKQFWAQDNIIGGAGNYGAYEVPNKKTSLIFLDSYDLNEKVDSNGKRLYVSGEKEAYGAQQLKWLADYLISLPLGQDIVVFTHAPLTRPNNAANETINRQLVIDILNAWRTGGTKTFTSTREDYEVSFTKTFVGNTGKLIATIAGHNHSDTAERDTLFGGTVPSFSRTCGYQGNKTERLLNTVNETAFDVVVIDKKTTSIRFIAFGGSEDKYVNYTAKTDISTGNDVEEDYTDV